MSDHLKWYKSSHSDSEGSNCIEVAPCRHTIHVRDSKLGPFGPRFSVRRAAWAAFLADATVGGVGYGGLGNAG